MSLNPSYEGPAVAEFHPVETTVVPRLEAMADVSVAVAEWRERDNAFDRALYAGQTLISRAS